MSLPDVAALKRVLKLEDSTAEDTLIAELLARAKGLIQGAIQIPLVSTERTFVDEAESNLGWSCGVKSLLVDKTPFDVETLVVKDVSDTTIDAAALRVDMLAGIIRYADGSRFMNGPYSITCHIGLENHPDYADMLEPIVSAAIVDTVSDFYRRRTPSVMSETAGGGSSQSFADVGLPQRVVDALAPVRQSL